MIENKSKIFQTMVFYKIRGCMNNFKNEMLDSYRKTVVNNKTINKSDLLNSIYVNFFIGY